MPRRRRVQLDGVPLHIVQRGHNREPCFFGKDDYHSYLHWLGEALADHEGLLHAYVLMTNLADLQFAVYGVGGGGQGAAGRVSRIVKGARLDIFFC